jgi:hypothetical protein
MERFFIFAYFSLVQTISLKRHITSRMADALDIKKEKGYFL